MSATLVSTREPDRADSTAAENEMLLRCMAPTGNGSAETFKELARSNPDWQRLIRLAGRHGLLPMLHARLSGVGEEAVPPQIRSELQRHFQASAASSLVLRTHLVELLGAFDAARIPVIPYKGNVLAAAYYDDPCLRPMTDIDLYVDPAQTDGSIELIRRLGYEYAPVRGCAETVERAFFYNHVFTRNRVDVELHWKLSPPGFPFPADFDMLFERTEHVDVGGRRLRNLAPEDAIVVLSMHGARHRWNRLIWLADIAALVDTRRDLDWHLAWARARAVGCERALALALRLVEKLGLTGIPSDASAGIARHPANVELVRMVESTLFDVDPPPEETPETRLFDLAVRERVWDRFTYCRRRAVLPATPEQKRLLPRMLRWCLLPVVAFSPNHLDWAAVRLAPRLRFLHYPLRPARLLLKHTWWLVARRQASHASRTRAP